jgi:RNA-dependent RNA polymerase
MLLGVPDETNSLQYGQVFIQLRDLNGKCQVIHDRKILITKNPAHFPGDIRKLDAVDCPALHHLVDCVVYPTQGQRPHPNEISGSDLDGDEVSCFFLSFNRVFILFIKYWVCWHEDLVNNASKEYAPATFDSAGKTKYDGEITMIEIAAFLFKYLSSDSLGALSNRHLACCALYGANDPNSCKLAKIISEAVDFPKTGVLPKNPKDIKLDQYPDFMENKFKESFESNSSLGIMYRQVKEVCQIHSKCQNLSEQEHIHVNQEFIIRGYEEYINEAEADYQYYTLRLNTMLSIYNLDNEYELITGCHSCPEEEKKNNDSAETALLEFRRLVQEMRIRFAANQLG